MRSVPAIEITKRCMEVCVSCSFCSVLMGIDKVFLLVVVDVISIHVPLGGVT